MTPPDRELTDERVSIILDYLRQAPNAESGIKAIRDAFSSPSLTLNTVADWVQVLLQRGLIRVARHVGGRPIYGSVDLDTLLDPDDVDDTLRTPILAALSSGPAMASSIAERLNVPVRVAQSTTLAMWRDDELLARPVGAGFVMRAARPLQPAAAAAILNDWQPRPTDADPDDEEEAASPHAPHTIPRALPRPGSRARAVLEVLTEPLTVEEVRTRVDVNVSYKSAYSIVQRFTAGGFLRVRTSGGLNTYQLTPRALQALTPSTVTYLGVKLSPAPAGKGWTPERLEWFKTAFPRLGQARCARQLGFSHSAISRQARELDLTFGDVPDYIRTSELAGMVGISATAMRTAARKAGVLVFSGVPDAPGCPLVPLSWADERSERSALPDDDEVLLTEITQDYQELCRLRKRFRPFLSYRTTPDRSRPQQVLPRRLIEEARVHLRTPLPIPTGWEDLLPWFEEAGPNGLNIHELHARSGISMSGCHKKLRRATVEKGVLEQHRHPPGGTAPIYRHVKFSDQPAPTPRSDWVAPAERLQPLLAAAGARGLTAYEAWEGLPDLPIGRLERTLDTMVQTARATSIKGTWHQPTLYFLPDITPNSDAARPARTDHPETAVAQALLDMHTEDGVTNEQLALQLKQSYYQVDLTLLRLLNARMITSHKHPPKRVTFHPTPDLLHAHALSTQTPAKLLAPLKPDPPQETPMTNPAPTAPLVPNSLVQQLAALEKQAQPLEHLQAELADLDQRRQHLITRIADAQAARDVLTRITESISHVLNLTPAEPTSEPVRAAVHAQPASVASTPVFPVRPEGNSAEGSDPERRRALFPAPIPDSLTPEQLRVFTLLRDIKDGLPFKRIVTRLNMPSAQVSKALEGLSAAGHLKQVGSHYRVQAQQQAA
ncbi:hypothetical protein [Deinococcus sp. ME38]|uniref:hypothetical protein n=1 Tax=Deinococcus sp. ME38 TaxID=3400344 RepID=UPI003B5A0F39